MTLPEPLLFERLIVPKIWGGKALTEVVGIDLPPGEQIGETWELYDRSGSSSRVRGSDRTLADCMRDPEALVGKGVPLAHGGRFPLLLKFLDAREGLSVQVHPDDEAAKLDGDTGKNECCVILRAGPNARIVRGLLPGVTAAEFRQKAATAAVESLLCSFAPAVGDTIHIPPGTVHAIGPDVVVFEVQQNSDLTYRLYDWGRGRQVHVQKALQHTRVEPTPTLRPVVTPVRQADGGVQLIATDDFRVRRYRLTSALRLATDARFATVTVVGGGGVLRWNAGANQRELPLRLGDTCLVPAGLPAFELVATPALDLMVCDPGSR
jgi:mannose-6-phosphate isomerase